MAEGKLYARIHPDARQDQTVVRRRDTCGIVFERGVGPYKGWHPVSHEQAEKLRRVFMSPNNPNSMRIFQIEELAQVDVIAGSEARVRMTPEARRIDVARDSEIGQLKKQLDDVQRALSLFGDTSVLARLSRLLELDTAASGGGMSIEAGDRMESVVAAPPRRPNLDERMLDDESNKRDAVSTQTTAAANANKAATPPPPRPGAVPGRQDKQDGKKQDGKNKDKDAPPARPGASTPAAPPAVTPPASLADALDSSVILADDDDNN
jgi:hypothetical protein